MPGTWTIAHYRGAPIRLHWSVLLGGLLVTGFHFAPFTWLALVLLVLVHELGHALLVRLCRLQVIEIVVHGFGGHCAYLPHGSAKQGAIIAWGGVLAQGALLALTVLAKDTFGMPESGGLSQMYFMFAVVNVFMIGLNLLPVRPLDGAQAWRLIPILYRQLRHSVDARAQVHALQARPKRTQSHLRLLDHDVSEEDLDTETRRRVRELLEKATTRH